jgi:hypothetical protein
VERDAASRAAQKLKTQVGELEIVLEPGVSIRGVEIDGEFYGLTAFPVYTEPGDLEVVIVGMKEGQRRRVSVEMGAGKRRDLLIQPFNEGGVIRPVRKPTSENGDPTTATGPDPELRRKRLRYAFYGSLGATLGSGAALGVVGGLTLDAYRDYKRRCTGVCGMPDPDNPGAVIPGMDGYPQETDRRFHRLRPAATALVIVTSALALTTVTLAIFAFVSTDRSAQRASTRAPKPGAQFTGNGVRIRW